MLHDDSATIGTRSSGRARGWRDHDRSAMRPATIVPTSCCWLLLLVLQGRLLSLSPPPHSSFLCFSVGGSLFVPLWFGSKISFSCQAKTRFLRGNPCFSSGKGLSLVVAWH
ncbi:vesicle-associated membrane protein [Sesbania bispinosa]|nr:vesicle-associated membrane protein [Sesbania bispinosa]